MKEGIKYRENQFIFDYSINSNNGIIKLHEAPLYESPNRKNTYHFGYKLENGIDDALKSKFIKEINCKKSQYISEDDIKSFIADAIHRLHETINIASHRYILYPESKNPLLVKILDRLYDYTAAKFNTIELILKDEEKMRKLAGADVLIIQDTEISASMILECLKALDTINLHSKKTIFTILSKGTIE